MLRGRMKVSAWLLVLLIYLHESTVLAILLENCSMLVNLDSADQELSSTMCNCINVLILLSRISPSISRLQKFSPEWLSCSYVTSSAMMLTRCPTLAYSLMKVVKAELTRENRKESDLAISALHLFSLVNRPTLHPADIEEVLLMLLTSGYPHCSGEVTCGCFEIHRRPLR